MRRLDRFGLVLPVFLFSLPAFGAAPEVKTVPALGGDSAAAHDVLAERPTTLKGTSSVTGPEIQATWEFGDESAPFVFTVTNGHDVSARHTYSGAVGTVYTAKLTVVDRRSGEASSARYQVKIGENTLAVGAAIAIDEGLWYLHRTMNRATGDWQGDCGRACNASGSVTASNVLAFEAAGFLATGDASNPYTETVDRALRTLVRSTDPALRTGDWVRALEAADTPERVVENGPADVMGRTFGEIVSRTLETQNLKAKASGARAASANVTLEAISSLIGRQNPAGYWTNESDEAQASFETASAVFAVASNFRSVASTISIVSSQVQVTSTGFLFSRVTQTFNGTMTVKNISGSAIAGPIVVVLTNLPVNVTLVNAGGTFNGSPYIVVPAVALLNPGQSAPVALRFANPGNAIINFVPVTYSGTFPPNPVSVGCPANTGTEGTPYNSAVLGNGGVLPYTFSIGPGALPGGLTLNPATGAITGNPNSTGLFNFTANLSDGTGVPSGNASANCSINVTGSAVAITVQTVPAGLTIIVDGNTLTAPQVFNWVPGSNHTIATTTPQGSGGTRYVFNNWSDAGAISHSVTTPGSATTYTASFDTEYQLTTAAGAGGTVSPASGSFFPAGSVQNVTATANSGFVFANWTGPVANAASAATTVTMSAPVSVTANFTSNTAITVQTVPAGLTIIVDGNTLTAPQVFSWVPGSSHTIATTSPQGSGGTRYVFNNWSDAGAISHTVTAPGVATTFTATFDTEHQLTTSAGAGGTVSPASGTFFPAGSVQNVTATANSGFVFANWTGPVANAASAATTVTMSGPVSVTANFTANVGITVQTVPAGLSIIVDGNTFAAPQVFNWVPGSNHTIATVSPQGSGGTRYVFNNWSDAGAISHAVVAPGSATTFTATFDTEYLLTTAAGAGGTVTPASGSFFAAGSVQNVSATPNSGFAFNGWTGPVANAAAAATTVTMSGPVTVTAAFATLLTVACPATTTVNIGTPYSDSLVAAGGTPGYTYSLQSGTLPPPLVVAGTGLITGTPTTKGTYNFVGKVVDSTSPIQQTATANCSIVVPNRAPTATGQSVSTNEDTAKVITLAGSDLDGDALTFTIVTPPTKGAIVPSGAVSCSGVPSNCTRNFTYTPTANLNGPDSFTFKVNDGTVDSAANATVTITINAVNDAPVATAKPYIGFANMRIVIPAAAGLLVGATDPGDPENSSPVFTVGTVSATSPAGGAVTPNLADGSFTFDPPPGVTGNVSFTYTVCDNGVPAPAACSAAAAVTVNVGGPVIWFVNTAGGAGNGTLLSPFNTLASATTAMGSNTNQRIFVYSGTQALGAGVTLPADGWLVGQGVTGASFDAAMGITPPVTAIARPSIGGTAPIIRGTVNMNGNNVNVRGLSIQPGSGVAALAATQTGPFTGLVVSDIPNVAGSSARAVDLRNVSGTFTITSVNASNTDIGINLSNLNPSTGSFSVVGGGGVCSVATTTCTGGSISSVTDTSVKLDSARNVTLTRMRLNGSSNFGLNGNSVTNLSVETCLIDGAHGDALNEGALYVTNWLGSGTINSSHITGGANDNIRVVNSTGVLNRLTISNSTITNPSIGANANHGLRFATNVASNAGNGVVMNLTVQNSTFRNNRANHFDSGATGLSTMDIVLNGNTFVTDGGYTTLAGAINVTNDHQSDVTFDVNGNSFNGALLSAVNFFTSNATTSAASMIGKFRNNAIGTAGVTNSASSTGNGFQVSATGGGAVTMNITGNAIRNWGSNYGIDVAAGDGSPTMNFTVTGNTLNLNVPHPTNNLHGVHFNLGTTAAGAVTACVDVGGAGALVNTVNNAAPATGSEIRVRQRNSSTVRLPGFSSGTAAAFLFGRNTASSAAVVTTAGTFSGGAACTQAP